ncbi:MAG: protease inhibitor I9 family protein [Fulvivirga sp.]|nr:protease inhibitor I9 family protein [Fulvivirga sp.]
MANYIVTLHDSTISDEIKNEPDYDRRQALMKNEANQMRHEMGLNGDIERVYGGAFFGFVLNTSEDEIEQIKTDPRVKYVEKDAGISY